MQLDNFDKLNQLTDELLMATDLETVQEIAWGLKAMIREMRPQVKTEKYSELMERSLTRLEEILVERSPVGIYD